MCELQSTSLSVYTVMMGAGRYSLNCFAEVPGLREHSFTNGNLKMLHLVFSPQYLTLLL